MQKENNYHMTMQDFRHYGHAVIDWIADYYDEIENFPVLAQVQPGEVLRKLPPVAPQVGEDFDAILKDMDRVILPGITHWQSPNFFAYFPCNTSAPSILADLLSSGLGVQGMNWMTSPACTELETLVLDWLVEAMDLPQQFNSQAKGGGVIQDSASSASLCAILAARERATGYLSNEQGYKQEFIAYISSQAHSSIEKGIRIAGIGRHNIRILEVDEDFAMRPAALEAQILADRQAGKTPFFVGATIGTTSSNAIDPLPAIGSICQKEGIWLHVDAAMAGTAAICPEFRWMFQGLELADSYCFNPHKWMFTNFDCDCFYVADKAALIRTFSILPEYLRNLATESGAVIDYRDWQIPLGRRFRSLKLWFVIRYYGIQGLQFHIRKHVDMAQQFASWVKASKDFQLAAPAPLNLVCFRHKIGDEFNQELLNRINNTGKVFLTHTRLDEKFTLRMCIGQTHTELRHVRTAWELIEETANELSAS